MSDPVVKGDSGDIAAYKSALTTECWIIINE